MLKLFGDDCPRFVLYEYDAGDESEPVPSDVLKILGCPEESYSEVWSGVWSGSSAVTLPNPPKQVDSVRSDVWVDMWMRGGRCVYAHFWNKLELQEFGVEWRGCAILAPVELTPSQVFDCERILRASSHSQYVGGAEGWEYKMQRF